MHRFQNKRKMEEQGREMLSSDLLPLLGSKTKEDIPTEQESTDGLTSEKSLTDSYSTKKKYGGWRTMPYIIGNETFERLASFGLMANFMVYITRELHLDQVYAANMLNMWHGINNFLPLVGAYISDAYAGRFLTIAVGSFASFLGMVTLSLTAWIPRLHPPPCTAEELVAGKCIPVNQTQQGVLMLALGLLSIGSGGIRPCSTPFGVDQFDPNTEDGKRQLASFFNLYYATFTVIIIFSSTVVVYIQDAVSWKWGFAMPTTFMFFSIILFFLGMRYYVYIKPEGSMFPTIAQVLVASYRKRKVKFSVDGNGEGTFYNPPLQDPTIPKFSHTNQYSWLSKAAVITEGDRFQPDGTPVNKWEICSLQRVEEVKCIVRIIPVWASGIINFVAMMQQGTFIVSQALKMDRHWGENFEIPAGSLGVISYITIGIWVPIYDRLVVPALRKITKHDRGITLLQRIGIGIVFSVLAMIVSGVTEKARRASAIKHGDPLGVAPISVLWLAPQLVMMGFCEAFFIIGQVEFLNMEFPEQFKTLGNSLFGLSMAAASYVSTLLIMIIHKTTKTSESPDWLTNDINKGRLDYYFYIIAILGVFNFFYFIYCARRYHYKGTSSLSDVQDKDDMSEIEDVRYLDTELGPLKRRR